MKICLICNREIIFDEQLKSYKRLNFKKRKYCSDACYNEAVRQRNKQNYKLKSSEHNDFVKELSGVLSAEIVVKNGVGYFSDLRKDNIHYEVQLLPKHDLVEKSQKWNILDDHILIIPVQKEIREKFNKIFAYTQTGQLVEI